MNGTNGWPEMRLAIKRVKDKKATDESRNSAEYWMKLEVKDQEKQRDLMNEWSRYPKGMKREGGRRDGLKNYRPITIIGDM